MKKIEQPPWFCDTCYFLLGGFTHFRLAFMHGNSINKKCVVFSCTKKVVLVLAKREDNFYRTNSCSARRFSPSFCDCCL